MFDCAFWRSEAHKVVPLSETLHSCRLVQGCSHVKRLSHQGGVITATARSARKTQNAEVRTVRSPRAPRDRRGIAVASPLDAVGSPRTPYHSAHFVHAQSAPRGLPFPRRSEWAPYWQISEFQFPKPYFQLFCSVKYHNQANTTYFSVVVCLRCLLHHILSLIAYTFRENQDFVFITIVQFMMSPNIIRLFVYNTISLSSLCKLIWRHWTYKMPVRYIFSSVWVRLSIFSQLFIIQYIWCCVYSVCQSPLWWLRWCILCLIIIIKSEVWTITHCLGLGHKTMVCAVCLHSYCIISEITNIIAVNMSIFTSIKSNYMK